MDKKEYTVAERIKCGLDLRGMRAVDLSRKTGLTKSIISQYMSGRTEPKQDNLFKISKALDIWPTWLMGYDVEIKPFNYEAVGRENDESHKAYVYDKINGIYADEDTNSYQMFIIKDQSLKGLGIEENDIIFYKEIGFVKNNELAVIKINDQLAVRRYVHYDIGLTVFRAENPTYKDISFKDNDMSISVQVVGKVMAFERILTK